MANKFKANQKVSVRLNSGDTKNDRNATVEAVAPDGASYTVRDEETGANSTAQESRLTAR